MKKNLPTSNSHHKQFLQGQICYADPKVRCRKISSDDLRVFEYVKPKELSHYRIFYSHFGHRRDSIIPIQKFEFSETSQKHSFQCRISTSKD